MEFAAAGGKMKSQCGETKGNQKIETETDDIDRKIKDRRRIN